jgi:hypothetical protein
MMTSPIRAASGRAGRSVLPRVGKNALALVPRLASRQRLVPLRRNVRPARRRVPRARLPRRRQRLRPTGPSPSSRAVRRRLRPPRPVRSPRPHRKAHPALPRLRQPPRSVRLRARSRRSPRLRDPLRRRPSLRRRERPQVTALSGVRRPRRQLRASRLQLPRPRRRRRFAPRRARLLRAAAASLPPCLRPAVRRVPCRNPEPLRRSRLRLSRPPA